jgi:hypothetical protein
VTEQPFMQTGIVVPDIEAAKAELTAALGLTWGPTRDREIGPWRIRVAFAFDGPPWIELIEGSPGTPWDPSVAHMDHLAWWTEDLEGEQQRLNSIGVQCDADGIAQGGRFTYHTAPESGVRIELIDIVRKATARERWGIA